MSTDALVDRLLADGRSPGAAVIALIDLLDDTTGDTDESPRRITETSRLVGLSAHTLRYYEREGLVRPARNTSGHREYDAADVRRLVFLTRMRVSGMTMHDLKRYITLVEQGESTIPERRAMMSDQRDRIARRIRELTLALEATEYKIRIYGGRDDALLNFSEAPAPSPSSPAG
ncbi:MerR family transcriptional regulator [Microbacterium karelineae]|uniref:MerR family transcriptional regulator n=1 Tax=Microbacterium karelineae TaxID=2654283 RepID=UPI0012EA67C6|nr:MerR family transcriptional regulator [Microbacterium karelineae]